MTGHPKWRTASELVEVGFSRSRVVMMNEAHDGLRRNVRTRRVGADVLGAAHATGARFLAMEAVFEVFAVEANRTRIVPDLSVAGYLSQPEMKQLIQAALDLGWKILPYEARDAKDTPPSSDHLSVEYTNWREEEQARNLSSILAGLPGHAKVMVWCGNAHANKVPIQDWTPMGCHFSRISGINPFTIDQTITIRFEPEQDEFGSKLVSRFREDLAPRGGTAGFLKEEGPGEMAGLEGADAYILSLENDLE